MAMAYCYDGKIYETIKEMAEEYGIDRQRIYSFRRRGWSLEDAMQMCINDVRGRGRLFEYNGKLYRSPKALAEEYGLPWNSLAHYIQRCKTIEEAVDILEKSGLNSFVGEFKKAAEGKSIIQFHIPTKEKVLG